MFPQWLILTNLYQLVLNLNNIIDESVANDHLSKSIQEPHPIYYLYIHIIVMYWCLNFEFTIKDTDIDMTHL